MLAEVKLKEALSYSTGKRKFVKGKTELLTDPNEIAECQANSAFIVKVLPEPERKAVTQESKSAAQAKPAAKKAKSTKSAKAKTAAAQKGK